MVTIRINESSKQAKAVVEMLKTFPFVEVVDTPRFNSTTEQAMQDAKEGNTTELSLEDFRNQLYN